MLVYAFGFLLSRTRTQRSTCTWSCLLTPLAPALSSADAYKTDNLSNALDFVPLIGESDGIAFDVPPPQLSHVIALFQLLVGVCGNVEEQRKVGHDAQDERSRLESSGLLECGLKMYFGDS